MIAESSVSWSVLLIGGPSGVGKSLVAKQIARRFGLPWLQVDDLRLALQRSRVTLPSADETRQLYFFEETPHVWQQQPQRLCDGLIDVANLMSPAIAIVIENHIAIDEPIVVEGDGILPSLLARPDVRAFARDGRLRAVFLDPPDETSLLTTMKGRARGIEGRTEAELQTEARAKWLFRNYLAAEVDQYGVPLVASQPWETLADRILAAT